MISENAIANRLTAAYVAGLLVIATLSGAVHILLDRVVVQQRDAGTVINVAGRQRMLTQRIALLSRDVRDGDPAAGQDLIDATQLMARSEDALVVGGDLGIDSQLSPAAHSYYFEGETALDPAVRDFLAAATRFSQDHDDDEAYRAIQSGARNGLLPNLDGAVALFEREANARVEWLRVSQKVVLGVILLTLLLEATLIFRPLVMRVKKYASSLYQLATRDDLTGLSNRRHFLQSGARDFLKARQSTAPLSVIIIDLDNFKKVNDTYGHAMGDSVLKRFSEIAETVLPEEGLISRIGGEEFALVMYKADAAEAMVVAEKLRCAVANDISKGLPAITVSIGVGVLEGNDQNIYDVMHRADAALYNAKREGRDRVVLQPKAGQLAGATNLGA